MPAITGPNADVLNRLPRFSQRRTLRGARIVDSEAPADDRAGAVIVALDSGERYRITVSAEWWKKHGPPANGALLICHEWDGKLSVEPPAEFKATTTPLADPPAVPWLGR